MIRPTNLAQISFLVLILFCGSFPVLAEEAKLPPAIEAIFVNKCISCHNEENLKGGLSLQNARSAFAESDSGSVILPGDPDSSYLLELVTSHEDKAEMPKAAPPLSPTEVEAIREWIGRGAPWPQDTALENPAWWSLRPLSQTALPSLDPAHQAWVRTPVDRFIAAKHIELGLQPSPEADRRTLIRRLYFDLIGLPPTPEEIEAFVSDPDVNAYEHLVDRLLASPHYGERWARHWLDVVHYGETHGYDKDKPRPNAWPYRDYVIRSLNSDKPYSRFVQEQIAGDVLFPQSVDGMEGLGFLAAGPWDFIGHAEVPESKTDGKIARHLDRDDMVQNTMMTFNSLTVGCAQCHDHKFDPITQQDYYGLQAVFAALDRTDKPYYRDAELNRRWSGLKQQQDAIQGELAKLDKEIGNLGGPELAKLDQQIILAKKPPESYPPQFGFHSEIVSSPTQPQWVQIDLGEAVPIHGLEYVACHDDFNQIGAGFGFPQRYKIEISNDPHFAKNVTLVVDRTSNNVANPLTVPQRLDVTNVSARYIRFTATRLAHRANDYIFALAELRVFDSSGDNIALGKKVTASSSIEAPVRWAARNLVDDKYPQSRLGSLDPAQLQTQKQQLLAKTVPADLLQRRKSLSDDLARIHAQIEELPPKNHVYAATIHSGSGAFRGTGPDGGKPREIHLLYRGNVTTPGPLVAPQSLHCIEDLPAEFNLPDNAPEGERRAALAKWLTARNNPLTWRSIANRVWYFHFGRGIVDSPSDFGRMGRLPSHPQLLDWLAVEFRDGGQSLKQLHRLIVLSATYRQSSDDITRHQDIDRDNAYYWRGNRRHLEAEEIRDAMLLVVGKLDLTMGGPSFQDFVIEKPEHSPHYQYHLHDPNDPKSHRRAIYRFLVRSQSEPFMTAFNCADPSMQVAQRNRSITPLQALSLMNNKLTLAMAQHFAERVDREEATLENKLSRAIELALGRSPRSEELEALTSYAQKHGLANACRVILNMNEFVLVN